MVRWLYNSGTKDDPVRVITEQYFKDPWLSLPLRYSRDSTSGDLPKEETAGVQPTATTLTPTAFNSLISPSTPPLRFFSPIPQTLIGHSEAKWRVVELTECLWGGYAAFVFFYLGVNVRTTSSYAHQAINLSLTCQQGSDIVYGALAYTSRREHSLLSLKFLFSVKANWK